MNHGLQSFSKDTASAQIEAIHRSQAVIEFDLDGMILDANDNFLNAVSYHLDEIRGQHHRLFVSAEQASVRHLQAAKC